MSFSDKLQGRMDEAWEEFKASDIGKVTLNAMTGDEQFGHGHMSKLRQQAVSNAFAWAWAKGFEVGTIVMLEARCEGGSRGREQRY